MRAIWLTNSFDGPLRAPRAKDVHGHALELAPKGSAPVDVSAFHDAWVRAMLERSVLEIDFPLAALKSGVGVGELMEEASLAFRGAGFTPETLSKWGVRMGGIHSGYASAAAPSEPELAVAPVVAQALEPVLEEAGAPDLIVESASIPAVLTEEIPAPVVEPVAETVAETEPVEATSDASTEEPAAEPSVEPVAEAATTASETPTSKKKKR